ncbi:hypothetical protein MMC08_004735 [Hypocenomyce scalaris]|nr:hypothetical protein [Hypocenomyce scalaris]
MSYLFCFFVTDQALQKHLVWYYIAAILSAAALMVVRGYAANFRIAWFGEMADGNGGVSTFHESPMVDIVHDRTQAQHETSRKFDVTRKKVCGASGILARVERQIPDLLPGESPGAPVQFVMAKKHAKRMLSYMKADTKAWLDLWTQSWRALWQKNDIHPASNLEPCRGGLFFDSKTEGVGLRG